VARCPDRERARVDLDHARGRAARYAGAVLDVLVIGSGYGGSVIAARLAPRRRVTIVERGRWWRPGDFPESVAGLVGAYRSRRNPGGLWAMRLGRGTGNAFASAFGGSSAVNYGITATPDRHAFDGWPVSAAALAPYFARAREVLRPTPNPTADALGDKQFLDLVEPGRRVDLENTIDWDLCTRCGRCVPGCNVAGAKRSLDTTYLALAIRAGAEVRLETEACDLAPVEGGFAVCLRRGGRDGDSEWVRARQVVIAAGTLGTLDLLHRAKLPVGPWFGRGMSMNGDALAFLYDTRHRLSSESGAPISTSVRIPFRDAAGAQRTLMVMSGRVPMAAMRFSAAALALFGARLGDPRAKGASDGDARRGRWQRRLRDLVAVTEHGALSRSFMYKLDAQDQSRGTARFTQAGAVIDWPDYADDPILQFAAERLHQWAASAGGVVIPNIATLPGMRSFSVHPLGGCRMGKSLDDGVTDDRGRIFDPRAGSGAAVHPGLRIADGSIVPASLGVPPSLTIAALAERIADDLLDELAG
jgi:cholesterol oxidase